MIFTFTVRVIYAFVGISDVYLDVWQPPVWFDVEKRARKNLRHAAEKAFGLTPSLLGGKNEAVEELRIKSFFLPYWLVRAAIFGPIDFTFMRGSMEVCHQKNKLEGDSCSFRVA